MDQQPFSIRRLVAGDASLFADLNRLFGEAFEDADTYTGTSADQTYLEALLLKEHIIPIVAARDDGLAGGLVAYELDKFEAARSEIYIYDLAVRSDCRRRGVATALVEHLREIAADRGASVIFVQADRGDDPAISLYTKLGRREDVLHFDIPV